MQTNVVTHAWCTSIDKLTYWKVGGWVKYDAKLLNLMLRKHYDQILITNDSKVLETFNMNSRLKGIYKGDVLIIIASGTGQEIRKLKFQIKNYSAYYFKKLGDHFPVTSHKSTSKSDTMIYRNIKDIFQQAMQENGPNLQLLSMPSNYEEFVKMCLLDPTFPSVVRETQKIIQNCINNIDK